jgi:flagellar biogenesis protein FliO
MKVVAATRLSAKAQIVAVQIQGRTLLVGATDNQVTHLGWLDTDDVDREGFDDGAPTDASEPEAPRGTQATNRALGPGEERESAAGVTRSARSASDSKASRFRELLADAIGIPPKRNPAAIRSGQVARVAKAPVDELVEAAEDRYVGSDVRRLQTQRMRRELTHTSAMLDIEGQAQGLVARLNRPQT